MNEVAVIDPNKKGVQITSQQPSTLEMISQAMSNGMSMEHIEKFMELHERNEANEAKKAYHKAFAAFKADPPQIIKDMTVNYNNTKYNHASIGNVVSSIIAGLGKHGLSHHWDIVQGEDVTVTCTLTHELGYSESTSMTAPPDKSGGKNTIQAIASTITYLERYTLLAITGMATSEHDDDGRGSEPEKPKVTAQDIIRGIQWYVTENKTAEALEGWLLSKGNVISPMSDEDKKQIEAAEVEAMDILVAREDAPPETIMCPKGGIEVTAADCEACQLQCESKIGE